jgi:hypothetical protein
MRKLTRLQSLIAGTAFAAAGVFGTPLSAMAADSHPATTTTDQVVTAPAAAPAAPSDTDLHPVPVTGDQQTATPDHDQLANAKAIMQAAKDMNLPPRAYEIAVATSLQESNLHNLGDLGAKNDHDSLGLFQQRTGTGGWGTPDEIMDPHHAATAFLTRLVKIDGWDSMPLTQAAQKVQVSAYPQAYAKHETQAGNIIDALYGTGPYADQATDLR